MGSIPLDDRMILINNLMTDTYQTINNMKIEDIDAVVTIVCNARTHGSHIEHVGRPFAVLYAILEYILASVKEGKLNVEYLDMRMTDVMIDIANRLDGSK